MTLNWPAASGFLISAVILMLGVPASAIAERSVRDRLTALWSKVQKPQCVPPDFQPARISARMAWSNDVVSALTTLIGPIAAAVVLFPTIGVAGSTLVNILGFAISLSLFAWVLTQQDVVKWKRRYLGWFSPVALVGILANAVAAAGALFLAAAA